MLQTKTIPINGRIKVSFEIIVQMNVVELQQISKEKALEQVIKASAALKRIEEQKKAFYKEIQLKQEQARIMTELAIMRAREQDEEEAILALLM